MSTCSLEEPGARRLLLPDWPHIEILGDLPSHRTLPFSWLARAAVVFGHISPTMSMELLPSVLSPRLPESEAEALH